MPLYRYTASDAGGEQVRGEVTAPDEAAARRALAERGLEVQQLAESPEAAGPLTVDQAEQLTGQLAQLGTANLPLGSGLRAAAAECGNARVTGALRGIAARVDRGEALEDVIADSPQLFPRHVGGLVVAATKTGKLGSALAELLEHQRASRALRQHVTQGFAYPVFVACLAALVLIVALFFVSDSFLRMFEDFNLHLPLSTLLLIWWRDVGVWVVGIGALVVLMVCLAIRIVAGRAAWYRIVAVLPIIGPLSYWSGLAEWCSLVGVLVKNQIALPEALSLSADGVRNGYVARVSKSLSAETAGGAALSDALSDGAAPVSLVPLIRWGERVGLLHEAFATAEELFRRRVRIRALLLQSILPPILFVTIACLVLLVVGALFAPLLNMVQALS